MSRFVKPSLGFLGDRSGPRPLPPWRDATELAIFVENYRASGFRGGLNWYRNLDRNWELTAPWQDAQIHQPSLFIAGSKDAVITGLIGAKRINELERVLPNLTRKLILEGAGHWVQQERPDEEPDVEVQATEKRKHLRRSRPGDRESSCHRKILSAIARFFSAAPPVPSSSPLHRTPCAPPRSRALDCARSPENISENRSWQDDAAPEHAV
jgi:hypothetical protein